MSHESSRLFQEGKGVRGKRKWKKEREKELPEGNDKECVRHAKAMALEKTTEGQPCPSVKL